MENNENENDKQCKIDNELKLLIIKSDILSPLNVRDSFF